MRSRSSSEESQISSSSPNLGLLHVIQRADRTTKGASICSLALCVSVLCIGCATPQTAFIPPITASATRGPIDRTRGSKLDVISSSHPDPVIQPKSDDREIAIAQEPTKAKQEKAPTAPTREPIRLHRKHRLAAPDTASKDRRTNIESQKMPLVSPADLDLRIVPEDRSAEADSVPPQRAEEIMARPLISSEKHDFGTTEHRPGDPLNLVSLPLSSSNSGDLALRVVEEDENTGPSAAAPIIETNLAAVLAAASLSGTFVGASFSYAKGLGNLSFTIIASGNSVTGTWNSAHGRSGRLTGNLEGSAISGLRLEQNDPCSGTYTGLAIIVQEGSRLDGSYSGTDCEGDRDGSFIVLRH